MRAEPLERIHNFRGFIAALDQSGGSTPKTLKLYGINESEYSNESEMFDLVHQMRTRIITSPAFTSKRILAVILFEATMQREIEGFGAAEYLWKVKGIPTFLKVDNGLEIESNGVQLMKAIPQLSSRLDSAEQHNIIGTKMRSVIKLANNEGIKTLLDQQFELAAKIIERGFLPIIEPEVDIKSQQKEDSEEILVAGLKERLESLPGSSKVVLKVTLPERPNLYRELMTLPNVVRIAALSGGYSREEANHRLAENIGMTASFSRALTEGLSVDQNEEEFDSALENSINSIFQSLR